MRDHARAPLQLAAQQVRRVLADRGQAARLDEHDRVAAMRRIVERMHVGGGEPARVGETAL